jgi:hypothetical protein
VLNLVYWSGEFDSETLFSNRSLLNWVDSANCSTNFSWCDTPNQYSNSHPRQHISFVWIVWMFSYFWYEYNEHSKNEIVLLIVQRNHVYVVSKSVLRDFLFVFFCEFWPHLHQHTRYFHLPISVNFVDEKLTFHKSLTNKNEINGLTNVW